jgi:hypothetical protein
MILYFDRETEVKEGDLVSYKSTLLFWKWKNGVVTYVPGKSKPHPQMEHHGLKWVGVAGKDGTFRGIYVEPEGSYALNTLLFIARGCIDGHVTPDQIKENEW